jgi:Ca2+-binding EF-hand superfamily protein
MTDPSKGQPVPAAFTEDSINKSMNEGLIDDEGHAILRKIMKAPDKGAQYDQAAPVILLRNPSLSSTIRVPQLDAVKRSEINFGVQKDMYKNADKILGDKDNLSTKYVMRHSVTLARIEQNVRRVKSMVHIINTASHADVVVPNSEQNKHQQELDKLRSEQQKMRLRLMQSAALVPPEAKMNERPLDKLMVNTLITKVQVATETGTDFEMRMKAIMDKKLAARKKEILSPAAIAAIEKKLALALRDFYRVINGKPIENKNLKEASVLKKELTTRALLPFYKVQDIKHFLDIFAKVDEDFSGDLDIREWVNLFTSLNKNIPPQEARMIFMKLDRDQNGVVSLRELIPVIFSKATKNQLKLIIEFAESEMIRKVEGVATVTRSEIDNLFEAYDVGNIGFVEVGYLKERVRTFPISENAVFTFMESLVGVEDDEMFSHVEFSRLFKSYMSD